MFCPYCRAENPDDATYCMGCAKPVPRSGRRTPGGSPSPTPGAALGDSLDWRDTGAASEGEDGTPVAAGRLIAGRWRVEALLGRGGMGEVCRVFDQLTQRRRALEVIHPALVCSDAARARFREETALTQELRHEHIVQTFDVADDGDDFVYVMEDVEGGSLRDLIVRRDEERRGGDLEHAFALDEALRTVEQILAALAYAHVRGVLHRDVKPENVLLTADGHVKLADFGLAKLVDPARLASMSQVAGTPLYVAPEQLKPKAQVDARADLYAVGVMLYQLLTGEVPLGRFDPVSKLRPDSPPALDPVLDQALARRAEDRIASATDLRAALAEILAASNRGTHVGPSPESDASSESHRRAGARPPPDSDAIAGRGQAPALHPPAPRASSAGGRRSVAAAVAVALVSVAAMALWQTGTIPRSTPAPDESAATPNPTPFTESQPAPSTPPSSSTVGLGLVPSRNPTPPAPSNIPEQAQRQAAAMAAPRGERLVSQADGTVVDTQTGLQWAASDNGSDIDWPSAKRYAESLTLGGHSDWRLPTQDELTALYQAGQASGSSYRPACDTTAPPVRVKPPDGIRLSCYWLWGPEEKRGDTATTLDFTGGFRSTDLQIAAAYRCLPVRLRN